MATDSEVMQQATRWLEQDPDAKTRAELQNLMTQGNTQELHQLFGGRLSFGTAGLRAHQGPGPRRLNRMVVRQSTAGVAKVLQQDLPNLGCRPVVIGYDGRHNSRIFASDAAGVLAAHGICVELFATEVPTPVVGQRVKAQQAAAGIIITASHNPAAYNGFKVYWHTATQIAPPVDARIAAAIDEVALAQKPCPCLELDTAIAAGKITLLGEEATDLYLAAVTTLSVHPDHPSRRKMTIAYTPLQGVGARMAESALARAGFTQVRTVKRQRAPNPDFADVVSPNPEDAQTMDEVLALGELSGAVLACANDPDADRLAVAARTPEGSLVRLSGDELGLVLAHDRLSYAPAGSVVATTLVSSRLLAALARHHKAEAKTTLTGFKWLAQVARDAHLAAKPFAFAYEEALGYAVGDAVWDKDGISALVAVCELAAALQRNNRTLWDQLSEIGSLVGVCVSGQKTLPLKNLSGSQVMEILRSKLPKTIGSFDVASFEDLQTPPSAGAKSVLSPTNALVWTLVGAKKSTADGAKPRIIVRPSGTEPKLKCYYDLEIPMGAHTSWLAAKAQIGPILNELAQAHMAQVQGALA